MWSYTTQLDLHALDAADKPVLIVKHSNRCSISSMALSRLLVEKDKLDDTFDVYLVDVVRNRELSQHIATHFQVEHESPQVIVIHNHTVVYDESHLGINPKELYTVV